MLCISQTLGAGREVTTWEEGEPIGDGTARETSGSPVMLAFLPLLRQKHVWEHVHGCGCAHPYLRFSIFRLLLPGFITGRVTPLLRCSSFFRAHICWPRSEFESSKQVCLLDKAANFKTNNLTYSLISVLLGPAW